MGGSDAHDLDRLDAPRAASGRRARDYGRPTDNSNSARKPQSWTPTSRLRGDSRPAKLRCVAGTRHSRLHPEHRHRPTGHARLQRSSPPHLDAPGPGPGCTGHCRPQVLGARCRSAALAPRRDGDGRSALGRRRPRPGLVRRLVRRRHRQRLARGAGLQPPGLRGIRGGWGQPLGDPSGARAGEPRALGHPGSVRLAAVRPRRPLGRGRPGGVPFPVGPQPLRLARGTTNHGDRGVVRAAVRPLPSRVAPGPRRRCVHGRRGRDQAQRGDVRDLALGRRMGRAALDPG